MDDDDCEPRVVVAVRPVHVHLETSTRAVLDAAIHGGTSSSLLSPFIGPAAAHNYSPRTDAEGREIRRKIFSGTVGFSAMASAADPDSPWTAGLTQPPAAGSGSDHAVPRTLAFSDASDAQEDDGQPPSALDAAAATQPPAGATADAVFSSPTSGGSAEAGGGASSSDGVDAAPGEVLSAKIVCTSNQLEEEPWLPVRNIITMFRIHVSIGDREWDVMRRYSDFHELHQAVSKTIPTRPPCLRSRRSCPQRRPPIAERFGSSMPTCALVASPTSEAGPATRLSRRGEARRALRRAALRVRLSRARQRYPRQRPVIPGASWVCLGDT